MLGRPLRFLHLHGTFQPGGKEARVVRLMNLWRDKARHSIVIADRSEDGARKGIDPSLEVDFPEDAPSLHGKPSAAAITGAGARYMQGFDLVLTYNWGAMDVPAAHRMFAPFLKLPPLIHHEDGFNESEAGGLNPKRNGWRRHMLKSAHALVVPSRTLEQIAYDRWNRPPGKVRLIPNGIPVDLYGRRPASAIPGFEPTPGKVVVGTLAGLRAVKNLPRLVRAVAANRDRMQLVIVGDGAEREAILREAALHGLSDLYLAGHLSDPSRFVGAFDIFALSSDSEQFPISLVEAMSAGLPAASTDVGDVAAMVSPDNRPFVVPVGDEAALAEALRRLSIDPGLRERLGNANRERAQARFSEDAMVSSYAGLYGEALAMPDVLL